MRNLKRLGGIAVAVALAVVLAGPVAASDITVGQFVQKIAKAKNLDATDARSARLSLAAVGISLPSNLRMDATLTEGDVASIARSVGLNVRTASPDANFGVEKADRFVSSFGSDLRTPKGENREASDQGRDKWWWSWWSNGGNGEGGAEDEDAGDGRGKGKGKNDRTPTDPY